MIPVQFIVAGVIAAASFGAAWTYQGAKYERVIAEQRAAQSALLAEAYANAQRETERMAQAKDEAERKAAIRIADLRRDLARTRSVADGLRNDLATARTTLPDASCSTVRAYAITANTILDECGSALFEMAGNAESQRLDALKLLESWPK